MTIYEFSNDMEYYEKFCDISTIISWEYDVLTRNIQALVSLISFLMNTILQQPKIANITKTNLIFMPVYLRFVIYLLLVMYVILNLIQKIRLKNAL